MTDNTTRGLYSAYAQAENHPGSNKAASYIRALDLLGPILAKHSGPFSSVGSVWSIASVSRLNELYLYVASQQRLGEKGIFSGREHPSYWRSRFYSAAIKSLKEFFVIHRHEQRLWGIYRGANSSPQDLARLLEEQPIDDAHELVEESAIDFSSKAGRDVLRMVKARVNQAFFRKMVLDNFGNRCCLTGIPIPQVLRASHIVPWSEDEANRMNPANGICLSATYDAAFDAHLIGFDDKMRLILSPSLRNYVDDDAYQKHFAALEHVRMAQACRYEPDHGLVAKHRSVMA